jgi:hypothetical protein
MATYRAEIKVTPTGSFFPVTIESGAMTTAKESINHIYDPISMRNLRQVRGDGGGENGVSMPSGGRTWLVGLFVGGGLLLYLTPWVLMTVYGAVGTWVSQKITGVEVSDFADNDDPSDDELKKGVIVLASAFILGGAGFIHGTVWNKDLNKEYNLDGNQPQVQQVLQK